MNIKIILSLAALLMVVLAGCKEDNFEPPTSIITGSVVFEGEAVGVRSPIVDFSGDNTTGGIELELWQSGFDFRQKIPVYLAQDGTFSATVEDGTYQLIPLRGNGPWANVTDSIEVVVNGSANVEVPVQPYFVLNNTTFSNSGNMISASFNVQQVVADAVLENVTLFIGSTTIVDSYNNAANTSQAGGDIADINAPINLSVEVPDDLAAKGYVFARVGVKTVGTAEMLYSDVQKIEL